MAPKQPYKVPFNQWRPGRPAGHKWGQAGTIGAFVELSEETLKTLKIKDDPPKPAFVGASHVLAPPRASLKDNILSPGPPDAPRRAIFGRAQLRDYIELVRDGAGDPNEADIALAVMKEYEQVSNTVPSPKDPKKLVSLKGAYDREEIEALAKQQSSVLMIARSGLRRGTLSAELPRTIGLSVYSADLYLYRGCLVVQSEDDKMPFSYAGDSGALVYSEECKAVGFVVGANGAKTYFFPAKMSLDLLGVNLI